jgi:hypothetical protein
MTLSEMKLRGDHTADDVPQVLLDKVIKNSTIFADVLAAGPMVGISLDSKSAVDGLVKNHWIWRVQFDEGSTIYQIEFGVTPAPQSVGSNEAQYVGSSRDGSLSSPGSSINKPLDVNKPVVVSGSGQENTGDNGSASDSSLSSPGSSVNKPPVVNKPVVVSGSGQENTSDNGSASDKSPLDKFSEIGSPNIPPSILSDKGGVTQQPTDGAPVPGLLNFKVRRRDTPSFSTYAVHTFALAPGTTFGSLLRSLTSRGMEPFHFRKVGYAYLGCRDLCASFCNL